jgi:4'-phosphopantetheinyl transferase
VHLWLAAPDEVAAAGRLDACAALLSDDERRRFARLLRPEHRAERIVARALARLTLARHVPASPSDLRFVTSPHGRPSLAPACDAGDLDFNVSHTAGLVACAIARGRAIGVDVEDTTRRTRLMPVAERFFAPPEVDALVAAPPAARRALFFAFWTLKESYIKARGLGLAIPLARFWFRLGDADVDLTCDPSLADLASTWHFARPPTTPRHAAAVAMRLTTTRPPRLVVRRLAPEDFG